MVEKLFDSELNEKEEINKATFNFAFNRRNTIMQNNIREKKLNNVRTNLYTLILIE